MDRLLLRYSIDKANLFKSLIDPDPGAGSQVLVMIVIVADI